MVLDGNLTVGDVVGFNLKYLTFERKSDSELAEFQAVVEATTKKTVNAFQLLMAKGREFPDKKKQR